MNRATARNLLLASGGVIAAGAMLRTILRARRRIDLRGRVVVVTGGSRGLGLDLARECATRSARLALLARDPRELERATDQLTFDYGAHVRGYPCDVTIQAMVDDVTRRIVGEFGGIDVLINNAGTIQVGPMREMQRMDFEEAMALHFRALLYTTLAAMPVMRAARGGRIVNIASIGGKLAAPHLLPYTASKFALIGFSEGLRVELAKENIFVTTVVPGLFRSGSARNAYFKGQHQKEYAWFATTDVLPVMSMSPRRLARQIINAAVHGQAELISPLIANIQAKLAALAPNIFAELTSWIDRMLPASGGIGPSQSTGSESDSDLLPDFARRATHRAAAAHNEL